jgi:hypothetical protein
MARAKFGKETVAGAYRRPKWVPNYSAQVDSGRGQDAQALFKSAHVRRLLVKRKQRKGKLILSL